MKKINSKGFTLMEVLAVVVIITIIGLIAVPNILSIINTGKNSTYDILVKDITIAAIQLHEEVSFISSDTNGPNHYLVHVESGGPNTGKKILRGKDIDNNNIEPNSIKINLQTLVSNGFLTGTNNAKKSNNSNEKIIINPKTKEDMGGCIIMITKTVEINTFKTSYAITNATNYTGSCPKTTEYEKALNIVESDEE